MVYIVNFLSIYFLVSVINGQKFGYNDRYTCHCKNSNCDKETGICNNNGCIQGWFGPTCQKENVALNKATVQSSQYQDYGSSKAVDGNTYNENDAKCSHTAQPDLTGTSYWQVDLGEIYPIREIQIYLRDPFAERLRGYFVHTLFSNGSSTVCKSQSSAFIPGIQFTIDVNCEGQFLRITNDRTYNSYAHVNLCEVEIYVCAPGTYGSDCENFCYCHSAGERCTDGVCSNGCASGYKTPSCNFRCYGNQCQFLCSTRKCKIDTSSCDINTGSCNGECQIGYRPPDCQRQCLAGSYGDQCLKQCSDRQCANSVSCNAFTGECIGGCIEGYTGTDCTQVCSDGRYGKNCQNLCRNRKCTGGADNSSCDSKSGKCDRGCTLGYKPPDCIQRCDYNLNYGDQCFRKCSDRNCYYSTNSCDVKTGNCYNSQCTPGYKPGDCYDKCDKDIAYGSQCLKVCSQRNCSDTSSLSCDHVTGQCDGGCKPGYRLDDCSAKCLSNNYGKGCNKRCSERTCVTYSSRCDHITGECPDGCSNNYVGIDCTEKCPIGSYGDGCSKQCKDRQCKEVIDEKCENLDGTCINGCKPGYMEYDCIQRCKIGYYGENCNKSCQARQCNNDGGDDDICNPETGACDQCLSGYSGIDCTKQCSERKYGINCQYDCNDRNCINNTHCDFTSGICDGGCQDGFGNDDCVLRIQQKEDMSTGAIVGIIVAILCIIIMAGIIFIVFRKRRSHDKTYDKPEENTQEVIAYNQIRKEDAGPIYENSTSMQKSKSETMPLAISKKSPIENQSKTLQPEIKGGKNVNVKDKDTEPKKNMGTLKNNEILGSDVEMKTEIKDVVQKENLKTTSPSQDSKKDNPDDLYYNLEAPVKSNLLHINKLKEHVSRFKNLKSSFNDIYQKLPSGFTSTYGDSQIEENRPKNRFKGYYPYDYNRVILIKNEDDPHSDYINASYVDSYNQPKYFIAAQGPTKVTIIDFVRMIYEQKCERVLMLTNLVESGKYKCERYWPLEGKQEFGDITVKLVKETTRSYYIIRQLNLEKKNGEVRETTQFHFTAWLDHDVPRIAQLLDFLYHVEDQKTSNNPALVHCSAGIGRTGTYIAIDSLLKEGREDGEVDIQLRIKKMREQRKDMIQTCDQLKFVYEALAEAFETGRTDVSVDNYGEILKSEKKLFSLTKLSRTNELDLLKDTDNKVEKNRIFTPGFPNLTVYRAMSWKNSRGYFISDITGHDKESVWNLIMNEECEVVVYFSDKAKTLILADSNQEDIGRYKLSFCSPTKPHDAIQLHTIQIQSEGVDKECKIFIVQTKQINDKSLLTSVMTELVYQVGLLDSTQTPVALLHQSVRFAAMFCIIRNIIQRINDDNKVEILNSTRQILEILPNAVNTMEDYNFLYDTTSSYINSQSVYENL